METWLIWLPFIGLIVAGVLGSVTKKKFREQQVTFGKKANAINKTGAQIATDILQKNGIMNVRVIRGQEGTDHYNSKTNVISLSPSVHDSASVYAMSVAAHEVGHAIQWAKQYKGVKVRDSLMPAVQMVTKVSGAVMQIMFILWIFGGTNQDSYATYLFFFAMSLIATGLFQLSTLPIEFNASKRAAAELDSLNYLGEGEVEGVKKTLNAAAMTYVIAFVTTMMFVTILLLRVLARRK